jgi:SAM-dependent methyltransferase
MQVAAQVKGPAPQYSSHIDAFVSRYVSGWATADRKGSQILSVYRNSELLGTVTADQPRPDLTVNAGLDSKAGFRYWFGSALSDGDAISVLFESGAHLDGSPMTYRARPFGRFNADDFLTTRAYVASYVLHGSGIEIGAANAPVAVPGNVSVKYMDRYTREELKQRHPDLVRPETVATDIVGDGENLTALPDASQDFVIANHVVEHCEDPIGTIEGFCRVLRPDGVIFLAIPDKRESIIDQRRPLTTIDHLIQDHELGASYSRRGHYLEFVEFVERKTGLELYTEAYALDASSRTLHFHVWTAETFLEFMSAIISRYRLPIRLVLSIVNSVELLVVFRKA